MVVVVILVRRRLVKICVNLACWEKVIDSEKLARAQRISQEPLSRGFQQASSPPHHPHLHLHLQDDLWSENLFLCSSRSLSISLSLSPWETKTKTKGKHKDRDNNLKGDVLSEKFILTPSSSWLLPPLSLSLSEAEVEAAENWNTIRLLRSSSKELNYQVFCQKEFQNQIQSLKTWGIQRQCVHWKKIVSLCQGAWCPLCGGEMVFERVAEKGDAWSCLSSSLAQSHRLRPRC